MWLTYMRLSLRVAPAILPFQATSILYRNHRAPRFPRNTFHSLNTSQMKKAIIPASEALQRSNGSINISCSRVRLNSMAAEYRWQGRGFSGGRFSANVSPAVRRACLSSLGLPGWIGFDLWVFTNKLFESFIVIRFGSRHNSFHDAVVSHSSVCGKSSLGVSLE